MKIEQIIIMIFSLVVLSCTNEKYEAESDTTDPITPQAAIGQIQRGINIGNTLEPPLEGDWNNGPLQEYYFDDYKTAGFSCIRIPVRWDKHTASLLPFTVDINWMNRIEQIVDWGLERDLFIIINGHHEDWLKQDFSPTNVMRYERIWEQISERFKDKSYKLFFEMINEPFGLSVEQVDSLNASILEIIRVNNPHRIVVYSGNDYSNLDHLIAAAIPEDDYLMGYYHSYDPWNFAGEGNGTWGTRTDRDVVAATFQKAANWSFLNNIPVMIGEFGAIHDCDYNSRMLHYFTYVEEAIRNGIAFQVWDDGGWFGIYERDTRTWPEVKDILIYTYPESPTDLSLAIQDDVVVLSWRNRTTENTALAIERKSADTDFIEIARLNADANNYSDYNAVSNIEYYYRVIADMDGKPDMYSYPQSITTGY